MIRAVSVTADNGTNAILSLSDPWGTGVAVLKIDGLGPVKSDIFVTNYGARSGGYYNGSRAGTRDITFTLKPVGIDLERVRRWLYRLLPVQERVTLTFVMDHGELETSGYVESFEPDIFNKYSTYTVGIRCPDPFFTETGSLITTTEVLTDVGPLFEFPFSNPTYASEIEFSRTLPKWQYYITYDGTVPVGMSIDIKFLDLPGNSVVIQGDRNTYLEAQNVGGVMKVNGTLTVVSEIGSRSVKYTSPNKDSTVDLAWTTWEQGNWPILYPGENSLTIFTASRGRYIATVKYTKKYLGV